MSQAARGQAPRSFDPEAEQEVDFGRYWRLLGARWWLVAAGLVAGAIVGYAVSLGGSQTFKATATIYLGQPYTSSGNVPLQGLQTNPSTVLTVAHSEAIDGLVASHCHTKASAFRSGISAKPIAGNIAKNGQSPLVSLSVQGPRRKVVGCAANGLAKSVVDKIARFAHVKIASFRQQIGTEEKGIKAINVAIADPRVSSTDKLLLQVQLRSAQDDLTTATQLLHQAAEVEAPNVLTPAAAQRVTARSRRNTVVVAALIGLVLGAVAALMWDGLAAGLSRRR
jgi:capsular polysaccharide biosynthesis protein